MEHIAGYDNYKLDNPYHDEKDHELIECIYDMKIYEWELKEKYKNNSSMLHSQLKAYVESLDKFGHIHIQGSHDKGGTYIMVYVTIWEENEEESERKIFEYIILNFIK